MDILQNLSPEQRDAAIEIDVPVCILAGAGSGKTRVITHRIAYLVEHIKVNPYHILGVTFTNKAAKEMKERVQKLLPLEGISVNLGTFHGLAARFLRFYGHLVDVPEDFLIYDEDDCEKLIKKIIKQYFKLDKDETKTQINRVLRAKDQDKITGLDQRTAQILDIYYEEMIKAGAIDFNGLLRKFLALLQNDQGFSIMKSRVLHLMVDEFQDINETQSQIVNLLAKGAKTCAIVGDDDQSIYGWRGASAQYMHNFLTDFPKSKLYRLEENYRSTEPILTCANHIISHNKERLGKNLRSMSGEGQKVSVRRFFKDSQEARSVVEEAIRQFGFLGLGSQIAVLMRTNAQSRAFEEALHKARMPYRMIGGMRFYDRKEIRDVLAGLKCILYPKSDVDLIRLWQALPFGIGALTQNKIIALSKDQGISLFEASKQFISNKKVASFLNTLSQITEQVIISKPNGQKEILRADEALVLAIESFGFARYYKSIGDEEALGRLENIEQLVQASANFVSDSRSNNEPCDAQAFMENVSLVSKDESQEGEGQSFGTLTLLSIHAAKGLEFDCVFLVGLEEGILPHSRSLEGFDEKRRIESLEEERRLMYVGITRAKSRLFLSYCMERYHYGKTTICLPSRFLSEIPLEAIKPEERFLLINLVAKNNTKFCHL